MNKRLLHAGLWECEQFNQLSDLAKICYIGLITLADDWGRLKANPAIIRSRIFPLREEIGTAKVDELLNEIFDSGLVIRYEFEKKVFGYHPNWTKYQILREDRMKKSDHPEPPSETPVPEARDDNDGNPRATASNPLQSAGNCQPSADKRPPKIREDKIREVKLSKGLGGSPPTAYGDPDINSFLEIIKTETGRPPVAGQQSRRYASSFLKNLKKQYPDHNPLDGARAIITAAMSLDNPWHPSKCHDPKHLFYNWQEIVALYKFKKSPNSANDPRTEEQRRADQRLRDMREQTK